jgi:hypothetical protein
MRIFKYWVEHSKELNIDGIKQPSKVFGGSNVSEFEAIKDAENKLSNVQRIINGELEKDKEYEADILEEIIEKIDDVSVVTRNRYGALVLNTKELMFIDVDHYSKTVFDFIFRRKYSLKELMLRNIEKTANKKIYADFGFRVYETANGFRILITNKAFAPRSQESKRIMSDFNSDYLYRWLCVKQNCYRARLTPKPYRVKQKKIKVIYPNRNELQQQELLNWVNEYEQKNKSFSTCRLVKEYGRTRMNKVIEYHDKITGVKLAATLA